MGRTVRGRGRVVTADRGGVTVALTMLQALLRRRRDRAGRPIPSSVHLSYEQISHVRLRAPRPLLAGKLVIHATPGDPWRTFARGHRPYVIRFGAGWQHRRVARWVELYAAIQDGRRSTVGGGVQRVAATYLAQALRDVPAGPGSLRGHLGQHRRRRA